MAQSMMNAMKTPAAPEAPAAPPSPTPEAAGGTKFCIVCGKPMPRTGKFCPECGGAQQ
jgi:membrane protease subunit (stomatin/prohibitin family)